MARFEVVPASRLADTAAQSLLAELDDALAQQVTVSWVLTGGSTPLRAYREVARLAAQRQVTGKPIPWERVRIAMGDERVVAHDHPDSNWGQAMRALVVNSPLSEAVLLAPPEDPQPVTAAETYAALLQSSLPASQAPVLRGGLGYALDVIWLGVGEDGHCLSLFPGHPELDVTDRMVVAVSHAPKPPPSRITLTFAALTHVRRALVIASGHSKSEAIGKLARGGDQPLTRAVATIEAGGGVVTVLLDEAAASDLPVAT